MRNSDKSGCFVTSGDGYLRATTLVEITDIFGHQITRRVSVGRVFGVSLDESRRMIAKARENNPGQNVQAEFKVSL